MPSAALASDDTPPSPSAAIPDLAKMRDVFNDIVKYLTVVESQRELNLHVLDNFFDN